MTGIRVNLLDEARKVLGGAGVRLAPLCEAAGARAGVIVTCLAGRRLKEPTAVNAPRGLSGSLEAVSAMAELAGSLGVFVKKSGVFGSADVAADTAIKASGRAATRLALPDLPDEDPDLAEMALAETLARVADAADLQTASPADMRSMITATYTAESLTSIEIICSRLDPAILKAGRALIEAPEADVTHAAFEYYAGADLSGEASKAIVERRLAAASTCPPMAGFMAALPKITAAIDAGESVVQAFGDATAGLVSRPVFARLAHAKTPVAREMVLGGAFRHFPADQVPGTAEHWEVAAFVWTACRQLAADIGVDLFDVWNHQRFAYARGNWTLIGEGIVRKSIDTRVPHDSGLSKDQAAAAQAAMGFETFGPAENVFRRAKAMVARGIAAVPEQANEGDGTIAPPAINPRAMTAWVLRNCAPRVTEDTVNNAFQAVNEACSMFGLRVVLPTVFTEIQLPAAPVTPQILKAAAGTAFAVLGKDTTMAALADLGGTFRTRAPSVLQQLLSRSEKAVAAHVANEDQTRPRRQVKGIPPEIAAADQHFRKVFKFDNDAAEWRGLTPIIEVMDGIVVVPLTTVQQGLEEGSFGKYPADRCGVPDLNVCIGLVYSPTALASRGVVQTLSIRRLTPGGYERLAAAVIRLKVDADGRVCFNRPPGHEFSGKGNTAPPHVAKEAMSRYIKFVENNQDVIPETLASEVKDAAARKEAGRPEAPPAADLTLTRLLGYDPCRTYKLDTAWQLWIENRLVHKKWAEIPLDCRIGPSLGMGVRQAVRQDLEALGIRGLDRTEAMKAAAAASPAVRRTPIPEKVQQLRGIFT